MQDFINKDNFKQGILIPTILGLFFLGIVFILKQAELNNYISFYYRFAFSILAGGILIIEGIIIGLYISESFHSRFQLGKKILVALRFFISLIVCAIFSITSNLMFIYFDNIEIESLNKKGKYLQTHIYKKYYSPGKGSRYEYYFMIKSFSKANNELYIKRESDEFNVGDIITIRYLEDNPTIFREIGTNKELKSKF
jgi:hypothetical protein